MEKKKISKINEFNILGVNLQFIFTIVLVVFAILSLFVSDKFITVLEFVMGIDLFLMAYNNKRIYKKEKLTIIYVIFGICLILLGILSIFGVK